MIDVKNEIRSRATANPHAVCRELGMRYDESNKRFFCFNCQSDGNQHKDGDFSTVNGWTCHKCGWKGDAFALVKDVKGIEFPAAVDFLGELYGVPKANGNHGSRKVQSPGITLKEFAKAKMLPVEFLKAEGVDQFKFKDGKPYVRFPYRNPAGQECAGRLRINLAGDEKFRWKKGSKPTLYGLHRMDKACTAGYAVIVEGESDALTCWFHEIPAVGLPGAGNWKESRDADHCKNIPKIFVCIEPDAGGEAVNKWLATSVIRARAHLIQFGKEGDVSGLYLSDPKNFTRNFQAAMDAAVPWTETDSVEREESETPATPADEYGPPLIVGENNVAINQAHFAARYVHDSGIVHDPSVSRFYLYDPSTGLWKHQTSEATVRELGLCFQRIVREENFRHLLAKRSASLLHGLRELSRGIAERRDVFGQRRDAIHVANGMLVLDGNRNVELRPFGPEWYSRNRSEIPWNPNADCPRFKRELLLSAMDEDDASLIQRYAGQCLLGLNLSQTFLVLRGTAGAGKSTLANVIEEVIGRHNVTELRVPHLTERFELIRFVGRTLLSGKDVPGDFLNTKPAHVLKALVGGDTLEGEVKNGNESFSIKGRVNVLISTNTRLRVKLDSDGGAWRRRMLIVDYLLPEPAKPIRDFDALLVREEGEGILRWAVEGAIQLMRELDETGKMHLTDKQQRRIDDLLSESDSVRSFVRECIESSHGSEVTVYALTEAYRDYCEEREWEPLRDRQFQAELPDAMLEFHRATKRNDVRHDGKSVRGFRGVKLRNSSEFADDLVALDQKLQFSDASDGPPKPLIAKNEENTIKGAISIKGFAQASEASEFDEGEL